MTGIANDWTPANPRPLTAAEEVAKIEDWNSARLRERGRLQPAQREARARDYEAAAERNRVAGIGSLARRYEDAARILRGA